MTSYTLDGPALWKALDTARRREGWTWVEVADWIGCSYQTLNRLKNGGGVNADTLISILLWMRTTQISGRFIQGVDYITED